MTETQDPVIFSEPQWHFLTVLYVLGGPVHIDVAGTLAPLRPGELLDVLQRGRSEGLLMQMNSDTFACAAGIDPAIETLLRARDTAPFRRSLLQSIEERDLTRRVPTVALTRLLAAAGRTSEAAYLALEQSRAAYTAGQLASALVHAQAAIDLSAADTGSTDEARLYVAAATTLADLRFRTGQALDDVSQYLDKARILAEKLGDKRSRALIGLHQGRLYYLGARLEDTLSVLQSSLAEVESLGDDDILERTAEFRGLYAYLQGRHREALEHFDRVLNAGNESYNPFVPFYLCFSAACLGQFHRSIGLVDTYARRCLQQGQQALANHARVLLAYVLTLMGRGPEALKHLPDIQDKGAAAYWISQIIRLYQAFTAGRINEAHAGLKAAAEQWGQGGLTIHQYPSPWFLEMIDEFDRLGLTPMPVLAMPGEMKRILDGPNIHLKGVALRLKARRLADGPQKYNCLQESEECLTAAGDPLEVSKTRIELARLCLKRGEQTRALAQALKAYEGVSGLGERFFPDDLRYLLEAGGKSAHPSAPAHPPLEDMAEMIANLIPAPNIQDLLGQLVLAVSGYLRAERAGLFWFEQQGALLKSANNLSADEVFSEVFRGNLALVFTAHNRREPICKPVSADGSSRRVLCLPVDGGVLYFDNSYDRQAFDFPDAGMLRGLSHILSAAIRKVLEYGRIRQEQERPAEQSPLGSELPDGSEFLTGNTRMQAVLAQLDLAAASDATILITGETGVGKEILARRAHAVSARKTMAMVTVDLTSIPETLVESELFGHEKGAFTGADSQRRGRIESAHRSTLFIDELGEIPAGVQVKLLRTLQEKTCMRLGGSRVITSDFRLVAATNRDLAAEVRAGRFRQDLYYRVHVMSVHIPPLRERPEDILLLARHFLKRYAGKNQHPAALLTPEDEARLLSYTWPGNVRELQNVIERGVLLAQDDRVTLSLPLDSQPSAAHPFADTPPLDELQRRYITWVLERTGGRVGGKQGAAEILGIKRTSLNARMKKLGLR